MSAESNENKTTIEIPPELQGYGIETGMPDTDRLAEHGKLDRFRMWEIENLKKNPQLPKSEKQELIKSGVRKAVRNVFNWQKAGNEDPYRWN